MEKMKTENRNGLRIVKTIINRMGKKGCVYETLVKTYNRDRPKVEKELCECGKDIYITQRERHLKTKLHKDLMFHKERYKKFVDDENERRNKRVEELAQTIEKLKEEYNQLIEQKGEC